MLASYIIGLIGFVSSIITLLVFFSGKSFARHFFKNDNNRSDDDPNYKFENGKEFITISYDSGSSGATYINIVIKSGITFKNSGQIIGDIVVEKNATFINSGSVRGKIKNMGGSFQNSGMVI